MKNKFFFIALILVGLISSHHNVASAFITFDDLQVIVQQLQIQVQTLQAQVQNLTTELVQIKTAKIRFIRPLAIGSRGTDVKQIQEYLRLFPTIYPEGLVTGVYGPITARSVKRFQKIYSLPETGIVDEKTGKQLKDNIVKEVRARIAPAPASSSTITRSSIQATSSLAATPASTTPTVAASNTEEYLMLGDEYDLSTTAPSPESEFFSFLGGGPLTTIPSFTTDVSLSSTTTTSTVTTTSATSSSSPTASTITTPFSISNISVSNISSSKVTISWQTSTSSDSGVYYGFTQSYTDSQTDNKLVTSHSISLSGLKKKTTYHFHVQSKDALGDTVTSDDQTFTIKD